MKFKKTAFFVTAVTVSTAFTPLTGLAEGIDKAAVASVVRAMGYGCGIHQFKNFVLRGTEKHSTKANKYFDDAKTAIATLRKTISGNAAKALDDIEKVVDTHQSSLVTIKGLVDEGKTVKEIDGSVKISDGPAVAGLATLRAGQEWSALEDAEFALGYSNAIHQFKNLVI